MLHIYTGLPELGISEIFDAIHELTSPLVQRLWRDSMSKPQVTATKIHWKSP